MGRKAATGKSKRDDVAVKLERLIVDKARLVASRRGVTMVEYLSDLLRNQVEKDFARTLREMEATEK
jgi:hypothetical protein